MDMLSGMLVGHLVGDYLVQNDWMANGKRRGIRAGFVPLMVHCVLYTSAVALFSGLRLPPLGIALVFATHFLQDGTNFVDWWMDLIGQRGFKAHLAPWSRIVVDNSMHAVVLWIACQV